MKAWNKANLLLSNPTTGCIYHHEANLWDFSHDLSSVLLPLSKSFHFIQKLPPLFNLFQNCDNEAPMKSTSLAVHMVYVACQILPTFLKSIYFLFLSGLWMAGFGVLWGWCRLQFWAECHHILQLHLLFRRVVSCDGWSWRNISSNKPFSSRSWSPL